MAVSGVLGARGGTGVCTAVEHHAVLHPVEAAGGRVAPVTPDGRVDLEAMRALLDADVSVVSVLLANNEVGVVQPLADIAELVSRHAANAVLHTDAVQAVTWLDVATLAAPAALVSVAAHKFGGPKGVGALVVRRGTTLRPLVLGGGQELERRSGTHNVAGIVGMSAALRVITDQREANVAHVRTLRDRLLDELKAAVSGVQETGDREHKIAGNAHVRIDGIESEALLVLLDDAGVCASAGSACASGAIEPSHVLLAMGVPKEEALGALRLSLGPGTRAEEIDSAIDIIPNAVRRLRG
jgi:cysteine desulfurase